MDMDTDTDTDRNRNRNRNRNRDRDRDRNRDRDKGRNRLVPCSYLPYFPLVNVPCNSSSMMYVYIYILTHTRKNGTNWKQQFPFVFCKGRTEMANFR
jgi:hypothetical protein